MRKEIKSFRGELNSIFDDDPKEGLASKIEHEAMTIHSGDGCIPIKSIRPRNDQPRKIFDEALLDELAQSVKSQGIIQPIIVRRTEGEFYEIIVGERRWRAAKRAGLEKIPAIVRDYEKKEGMTVALIENIQRKDLNPLEEARAIKELLETYETTHEEIADKIGKSRTTITNLLRLLNLQDEVKAMVYQGLLEMGHARALLGVTAEHQVKIAKLILQKNLSVRETEKLIRSMGDPLKKNELILPLELKQKAVEWKNKLSNNLGAKVDVCFNSAEKGRVVIHFKSLEEIEHLMDKF